MADGSAGSDQQNTVEGCNNVALVCQFCLRAFTSRIGLSVHIRSQHPEKANRAVQTERIKSRWTRKEMRKLAELEEGMMSMANINLYLCDVFDGARTVEAIKGLRRRADYKEMVVRPGSGLPSGR